MNDGVLDSASKIKSNKLSIVLIFSLFRIKIYKWQENWKINVLQEIKSNICNKMKNEKYHTVETAPKSIRKIIERDPPKNPPKKPN